MNLNFRNHLTNLVIDVHCLNNSIYGEWNSLWFNADLKILPQR